jgi:hypothetical protein
MKTELFENEMASAMQQELRKQASSEETPKLVRAAECLHAALEILEEQGLHARADEVLQLLQKLAQTPVVKAAAPKVHSMPQLMEAGVTQRDLMNFAKGEPRAVAKLNLVLRRLGMSEHEIAKFLGHGHVMSEEQAHKILNPNEAGSMLEFESMAPQTSGVMPAEKERPELLEFKSIAKKAKRPARPDHLGRSKTDPATKGWTPEKGVKNLKEYGTPLNVYLADDDCAVDTSLPIDKNLLDTSSADFEAFMEEASFDAADDELFNMEVSDSLEVTDSDKVIEDFEDERD